MTICHLKAFNCMWREARMLLYGFDHLCSQPAAVILILGFVIYMSERKLNTTAQSHRKWVSNPPLQLILTLN